MCAMLQWRAAPTSKAPTWVTVAVTIVAVCPCLSCWVRPPLDTSLELRWIQRYNKCQCKTRDQFWVSNPLQSSTLRHPPVLWLFVVLGNDRTRDVGVDVCDVKSAGVGEVEAFGSVGEHVGVLIGGGGLLTLVAEFMHERVDLKGALGTAECPSRLPHPCGSCT